MWKIVENVENCGKLLKNMEKIENCLKFGNIQKMENKNINKKII